MRSDGYGQEKRENMIEWEVFNSSDFWLLLSYIGVLDVKGSGFGNKNCL